MLLSKPHNPRLLRTLEDPQPNEGAPAGTPVPKSSPKGQPKGGKEGKGGKGKTPKGSGKLEDSVPPPSSQSPPKDTPMCKGYLTAKGCAYGDQCRMQHDFASAGRQSLCYACGSLENRHRRPDCPTVTNPKGGSKGKGKTKGKPKVAATSVETPGPQITEVSESSVDPSHDVASVQAASAQGKASASSAVEQEALKILKGLRLACLTVDSSTLSACPALRSSAGQGGSHPGVSSSDSLVSSGLLRAMGTASDPAMQGLSLTPFVGAFSVEYSVGLSREDTSLHVGKGGSVEGDCVWNVSVSEGIVDSGASCVCRWAEVEEYRKASLQRVDLPLGAMEMRVAVTGSVLTLDTRPTILPMGQLVHLLGIQVVWDCFGVQMWHPREGFLDVRVQEGRVIVGARDTGLLVQELECAIELSALVQAWDGPPMMNVLDSQEDQAGIAISLRYVKPEENLLGLVDGGATNALRTGTDQEIQNANWINVELAAGKTRLAINEHGTLLAASEVTPIVPLGAVVSQLRCELSWDQQGVTLEHPVRGRLPVTLVKGCPMLPRALVLELILELEASEAKNRVRSKAMSLLKHEEPLGQTFQELIERSQADQEAEAVACLAFAKQLFPSAPHDLLKKVPPLSVLSSDQPPTSATTGLNRRIRRRLFKASSILVHLFSGVQSWKLGKGQVVLEVEESRGLDLLNDELFSFLVKLVLEGKVRGIIAGPPCTTFSRVRFRSPGPRVLRARYGSSRFGLPGLTSIEKAQLERDNLLILRMLYLIHVAQEVTNQGCFVAIEHPRDPSLLDGSVRDAGLPSLWEWPEMTSLNLLSAQVDQGRLGHDHVKPTTVYTNSWSLYEGLHNVVVAPKDRWTVDDSGLASLTQRIRKTRQASAWAEGMVEQIQTAWRTWISEWESGLSMGVQRLTQLANALESEGQEVTSLRAVRDSLQKRVEASLSKLSSDELAFKRHVECGHTPWRRDCRTCVHAAAYRSPCKRKKHAHMFTLCMDLAGPFKVGTDYSGAAKYAVVGVYTYPKLWKGGEPVSSVEPLASPDPLGAVGVPGEPSLEPPVPESLVAAAVLPPVDHPIPEDFTLEDPGPHEEESVPPDPKSMDYIHQSEKKWRDITRASLQPMESLHFPMAIPVFHKSKRSVLRATQQMMVALKQRGFPVHRLHTDRGREFVNSDMRSYLLARDICHTTTPADLPASNGLAERMIGILKTQTRALLYGAGLAERFWPLALRWASIGRFEGSLSYLGVKPRKMIPFGSKVVVQVRSWKRKSWLPKGVDATVLCPSPDVSKGWVVLARNKEGSDSFMITTLCYARIREAHLPEVEQLVPDPAESMPQPPDKASGSAPLIPDPPEDPPLPPPPDVPADSIPVVPSVPKPHRRLTTKTCLRATQGGVHALFEGSGLQGSGENSGLQ